MTYVVEIIATSPALFGDARERRIDGTQIYAACYEEGV